MTLEDKLPNNSTLNINELIAVRDNLKNYYNVYSKRRKQDRDEQYLILLSSNIHAYNELIYLTKYVTAQQGDNK